MELRHLRYFVAVAEQRSFLRAARHLRVAQPALSRQIRDLESKLGVTLFRRLPRGVVLTGSGEAFLIEARRTLEMAANAIATARRAEQQGTAVLHFAYGSEMGIYAPLIADLVAAFRRAHPEFQLRISNWKQTELLDSVRAGDTDVAATFLLKWPISEFESYRLHESEINGVLLGAVHPLAAKRSVQLRDLQDYTFLSRSITHWPESYRRILLALKERGLVPREETTGSTPSSDSVELAAGHAWSLANEEIAAPLLASTNSVVFRRFTDAPIPAWLALIWQPNAPERVRRLLDVARSLYPEEALGKRSLGGQQSHGGERRTEAVVDIHHRDPSRTAVEHGQERREPAEARAITDARRYGDDGARYQTADN